MVRAQAFRKNFKTSGWKKIQFKLAIDEQRREVKSTAAHQFSQLHRYRFCAHRLTMANVNYLLFESAVGFSVFEVVHQADTVGLELPEVKEAMKSLDKFGKMVQLRSFNPWTYVASSILSRRSDDPNTRV